MAWRREGPQSMVVTNASTVQLLQHPREACLAREEAALMDPVWRRKVAVLLAIAVTLAAILHRPLAYCSFRAQTQAGASPTASYRSEADIPRDVVEDLQRQVQRNLPVFLWQASPMRAPGPAIVATPGATLVV